MRRGTSIARELVETLVVAVIAALFARTFLFQAFQIPSASMQDSLLVGDHVVVNRFVFGPVIDPGERGIAPMRDVRRGDVVVFKFPEEPSRDLVKRVVGLPGETIEVRAGRVHVNGRPIEEPYLEPIGLSREAGVPRLDEARAPHSEETDAPRPDEARPSNPDEAGAPRLDEARAPHSEETSTGARSEYGPVTVPPAHLFVLGDNRGNSDDSRAWGFVPRRLVKGRAMFIYWSFAPRAGPAGGGARWGFGDTRWTRILAPVR